MTRLWDRGEPLEATVARFTVGRDPELDRELVAHDALGTMAHATMLKDLGILTAAELESIRAVLRQVVKEARDGAFEITPDEEDGHTALENRLTRELGDTGRRIHTGRSRNDQVIASLRLYAREALLGIEDELLTTAELLCDLADRHREVPVPGYSHTRQAMPSTLGFLFAAHAGGLLDDLPWLDVAFDHLDRSPLGSASGYGVALPLDRSQVAELLGFTGGVQENPLAVQNDRGKTEMLTLTALAAPVLDLGRLATDLIWFSGDEMRVVGLHPSVTTGSSIMPQKRNPDVLELIRAAGAAARARAAEVANVTAGLPSGYHRDLQTTKAPLLEGLWATAETLRVIRPVLTTLTVDPNRGAETMTRAIAATDEVYRRVAEGQPFRSAYRDVAEDPAGSVRDEPSQTWRERRHLGAPGTLATGRPRRRIATARAGLQGRISTIQVVWDRLGLT